MSYIRKNMNNFVDEKYGYIQALYELPNFSDFPRIYTKVVKSSMEKVEACGAGITEEQSVNSAIGEYIERYSCLTYSKFHNYNSKIDCISPSYLNSKSKGHMEDYDWISGIRLNDQKNVLLPREAVLLTTNRFTKHGEWVTTSTGAACGKSLIECCWKGMAEVLERDAFQYIWRRQVSCPKINIEGSDSLNTYYKKYIKSPHIDISLYCMEMDWEIPAVFGVAKFPDQSCVVSASVRPTWIEASKKTLLELAQSIVAYSSQIVGKDRKEYRDYKEVKNFPDHSMLYVNEGMAKHLEFLDERCMIFEIPNDEKMDTDEAINQRFVKEIKKIGKTVYFADVTVKEFENSDWLVGKVLIPNMLDIEPDFIINMQNSRLEEVDQRLIQAGKRRPDELSKEQPIIPHPFP